MGGWSVRDQPVTRPLPTVTFTWQGAPRGEGLYSATIPVPSLNLKGRKPPCLQTHFWHMEGGLCEVRGSGRGEEPLCFQGLGSVLGAGPHSRARPAWVYYDCLDCIDVRVDHGSEDLYRGLERNRI